MPFAPRLVPLLSLLLAAGALLAGSGCVATKYQMASGRSGPATPLALPATSPSTVQAELETVIVYEGPGAWKRRAFWDEYVVTLANSGNTRIHLVSAELVDSHEKTVRPGDNWENLERQSAQWWKRNATPENLALGAGMTVAAAGFSTSAIWIPLALVYGATPAGWGLALGTFAVSGASSVMMDQSEKNARAGIAAEFDRRRLPLPSAIEAGGAAHGSLFFPITPSPQKLLLSYQSDGILRQLTIDLAPLSSLHRKDASTPATKPLVAQTGH